MKNNIAQSFTSLTVAIALASMFGGCASQPPSVATPDESAGQSPFPGAEWTQAAPATQGFSQERIDEAIDYAKEKGSTSGMVVHHGLVIAEWGDVARKSNLHSARKSFMNALIGIAAARGQIHLDDTLEQLGIDDNAPSLSAAEKQATVLMLIEARSGIYHPAVYETASMEASKPPRYSHEPGTFWYYNNWDFNTVGAIYEKATGEDIFKAIRTEMPIPLVCRIIGLRMATMFRADWQPAIRPIRST